MSAEDGCGILCAESWNGVCSISTFGKKSTGGSTLVKNE